VRWCWRSRARRVASRRVIPKIDAGVLAAIEEVFIAHKNVRLHESVGIGAFQEAAAIADIEGSDFRLLGVKWLSHRRIRS
jgi:hypothetical protein